MRTLFTDIREIWGIEHTPKTCMAGSEMDEIISLKNAWLLCENDIIVGFGVMNEGVPKADDVISLKFQEVLPGFVDSHTHTIFPQPRSHEWLMRLQGKSYEDIANAGGGILNSALYMELAKEDELFEQALNYINQMIKHGTLAIEIKSGYGLKHDVEIKMLRVAQKLKQFVPIPIFVTYLGAHAIPTRFKNNPEYYMDEILEKTLPYIAEHKLADFVDVFCDQGFFTPQQTERILLQAQLFGIPAKIHANELGLTGGVQVATAMGAYSADHCEHLSQVEIDLFKNSDTVPVSLPGTSFFLGIPYTPLKKLIQANLAPAIASDFNPGSSPTFNMQFIWSLACTQQKLTPTQGFWAATLNAAHALRAQKSIGSIAIGKKANFFTTLLENALTNIPYFFATNHVYQCFVNAKKIY